MVGYGRVKYLKLSRVMVDWSRVKKRRVEPWHGIVESCRAK